MNYKITIGLEVHARLLTQTKCFCACRNSFGEAPNTSICPICTGQAGALPSFNEVVAEMAIIAGHAFHCEIHERSVFARKNYFYPDLPKGYQITQFEYPICTNGWIEIELNQTHKKIPLTRIHIEEDAGQLHHEGLEGLSGVDFNRCGVPLIEIVSEPKIESPKEAIAYLKILRQDLIYLGISNGNMQEGSFRCDVNISVRPENQEELGIRREIKNMNSFRHIQDALNYEIQWQITQLKNKQPIIQSTLLWDISQQKTHCIRTKEDAHDYRYFPEPDLPPLLIDNSLIQQLKYKIPELPLPKSRRFRQDFQLSKQKTDILCSDPHLADYFEKTLLTAPSPQKASNWILRDLLNALKTSEQTIENCRINPKELGTLIQMIDDQLINHSQAKMIFDALFQDGGTAKEQQKKLGLSMLSDVILEDTIKQVIKMMPSEYQRLLQGERKLLGFFMGMIRKKMNNQANMKLLNQLLNEQLQKDSINQ